MSSPALTPLGAPAELLAFGATSDDVMSAALALTKFSPSALGAGAALASLPVAGASPVTGVGPVRVPGPRIGPTHWLFQKVSNTA